MEKTKRKRISIDSQAVNTAKLKENIEFRGVVVAKSYLDLDFIKKIKREFVMYNPCNTWTYKVLRKEVVFS